MLNLPKAIDIHNEFVEARNEYLYAAGGQKLKVVQKFNPAFNTNPIIGSDINVSALTQSLTTDYVGNKIYENGVLKRTLIDGGYIEGATYHYYLADHLGNNRMVVNSGGTVVQKTHYYPFGAAYGEATGGDKHPHKYNGKEPDSKHGLNMYDYAARYMAPETGRFTSVDPLAEKYYSWSPYVYCLNNPLRFIDIDGRDPGDVFKSKDDAAKDWGRYYNGISILNNREFSSSIYEVSIGTGKNRQVVGYSYSIANEGSPDGATASLPPGSGTVWDGSSIHSHGAYDERYDGTKRGREDINNNFSSDDKAYGDRSKTESYLATPDGSLKKYEYKEGEPEAGKVTVLTKNLASDPKDPGRKNNVDPLLNTKPSLKYNPASEEESKRKFFND